MVTINSVFVYDTQHIHPIVRISGCHLATINDASWSPDGNTLVMCSSDGYVSFVRFEPGELGEPIPAEDIPAQVKNAFPCFYGVDVSHTSQGLASDSPAHTELKAELLQSSNHLQTQAPMDITEAVTSPQAQPDDEAVDNSSKGKKRRITPMTVDSATGKEIYESSKFTTPSSTKSPFELFSQSWKAPSSSSPAVASTPQKETPMEETKETISTTTPLIQSDDVLVVKEVTSINVLEVKKKKRIAPVLLSSSSSSASPMNWNSTSSSGIACTSESPTAAAPEPTSSSSASTIQ